MVMLMTAPVFGQAETTGRISGRVVDEEGEPVAGARVALISSSLQGERTTRTDDVGDFLAALLPVGPYAVSVAAPGKQTVQVSLRLGVGQTVPLEIVMRPGEPIVEEVTVYGTATPLKTTVVGENFDYEKKVEELPINPRNIINVATYAPNVVQGPWTPEVLIGSSAGLVISGAPQYESIVQLEGADISDPLFGNGVMLYLEDAIREVQVQIAGLSARYGRFQGGVINTITKSGGNEFDGTFRIDLSNQSWNSKTPFGEEQSDDLNELYQATFGGYMLKDKLWFFLGGRLVPTKTTSSTTVGTGESFENQSDDKRWQIKLRGAVSPDHVLEASYLDRDFKLTGGREGLAGDLLAATSYYNLEPMSLFSLGYQGILGPASFLDVRASSKRHGTTCCSSGEPRSLFFDVGLEAVFNNEEGDPGVEWRRDSESASVAFTHVFSGAKPGSHTLEAGAQYVRSTMSGIIGSPTGFSLDGVPLADIPFTEYDPNTGDVTYNLGGDVLGVRWEDIPVPTPEGIVDNFALYAQDGWRLGRWRFDLGLRWDRYDVSIYRDDLERSFDALAPRLGVTFNISPQWQAQATWGRYYSKFQHRLLSATASVFGYTFVQRLYSGPELTGLTNDEVETILRDDDQWGRVVAIQDPDQPTSFLADDIDLPHADELTLGLRAALPGNSGSITATYVDRDFEDLFEQFVGGYGEVLLNDPFDPTSGETLLLDRSVWDNASTANRRYRAVVLTGDYRPGARWTIGGNWTYSELTGNHEAQFRQVINDTAIGTYERSRPEGVAAPEGYLLDDVSHRVNVWGNYHWDLGGLGALALGGITRYESGRNWSRTALVSYVDDPEYVNDADQWYVYYFDGRGQNRFDGWWSLDLSARWQFPIFKRLNGWVKATIFNVFDNDALISYSTTGFADDTTGNPVWVPSESFGAARGPSDYQVPRSYLFTLGLAF
jgi:hypothetical protein